MNIEILYPLVTEAILHAERLEDLGVPSYQNAYQDVSLLEERIATLLSASDEEGAIARRGAIRAAMAAHKFHRAEELITKYSAENDLDSSLEEDLKELRQQLYAKFHTPNAIKRHGSNAIWLFISQFQKQGAPLPMPT